MEFPIIAVIGYKNAGKTTVVEKLIEALTSRGYKVATVKHIHERGFSVDKEGTDTWRHAKAGAKIVVSAADSETAVIVKEKMFPPLEDLTRFLTGFDALVLEGFRTLLGDERVAKIICVKSGEEASRFGKEARGRIIAFCSFNPIEGALKLPEGTRDLLDQALTFVDSEKGVLRALSKLPRLDCGKCGYPSCRELALNVHEGRAKLSDCKVLEARGSLKTRITVDGVEVPIQRFVAEIVRSTVLGMVSTLKGVSIKGDEEVRVEILRPSTKAS